MKTRDLLLTAMTAILSLNACTQEKSKQSSQAGQYASSGPRFEELKGEVPSNFTEAQAWNQSKICPEGSELSPFTRYSYDAGEDSHGYKHYYGRSCTIIQSHEPDGLGRKLASINPLPSASVEPGSISLLPHGPYIWWYETGAKMESGTFDHGTLAQGHSRYQPDGSPSRED